MEKYPQVLIWGTGSIVFGKPHISFQMANIAMGWVGAENCKKNVNENGCYEVQ